MSEKITGYFKHEEGKEFFSFNRRFAIEVQTEKNDGRYITLVPTLDHSMMVFQQAVIARVPVKIDSFDLIEELKERKASFIRNVNDGMIEQDEVFESVVSMVLDAVNSELSNKYWEAEKMIKGFMEDYSKCFLWKALGFAQYPLLRKKDGIIEGLQEGYELEITSEHSDQK